MPSLRASASVKWALASLTKAVRLGTLNWTLTSFHNYANSSSLSLRFDTLISACFPPRQCCRILALCTSNRSWQRLMLKWRCGVARGPTSTRTRLFGFLLLWSNFLELAYLFSTSDPWKRGTAAAHGLPKKCCSRNQKKGLLHSEFPTTDS